MIKKYIFYLYNKMYASIRVQIISYLIFFM